jgi:hypothetical protein
VSVLIPKDFFSADWTAGFHPHPSGPFPTGFLFGRPA